MSSQKQDMTSCHNTMKWKPPHQTQLTSHMCPVMIWNRTTHVEAAMTSVNSHGFERCLPLYLLYANPMQFWGRPTQCFACSISVLYLHILKMVYLHISAYWSSINSAEIAMLGYDWRAETLVDPRSPIVILCDNYIYIYIYIYNVLPPFLESWMKVSEWSDRERRDTK